MNFKADVKLCNKPGNLKGIASVVIEEQFAIRDIRIVDGKNGLFLSMPSRKVGEDYVDICFPITNECRQKLSDVVVKAYEEKLSQQKDDSI